MNTVILDDELKSRLNGLDKHMEIRDTAGKLVGHFLPDAVYMRFLYDLAKAEFAREESEKAAKGIVRKWDGTNGKTTAEAIAYVKKMAEQIAEAR
ncbi:MAG: hypothetical protein C0467_18205 [Planctomycetaceae bacterium]|nr:hypothetical protein [Planctomycetaceae bacterium]